MTHDQRFERGKKNLAKVDGLAGERVIDSLKNIAPHIGRHIIEFAFGEIYESDKLPFRDREIITIACLVSQGDTEKQLLVHLNGCLNVGLSQEEIVEILTHCIPYVGFPKVLNAIAVAEKSLQRPTKGVHSLSLLTQETPQPSEGVFFCMLTPKIFQR